MFEHAKNLLLIPLLATLSLPLAAAPIGYSINTDSPSDDADSLYRIDLATGAETRIGKVMSQGLTRIDVEGLAFAPDGTLYGVDDESMMLFPLSPTTGVVQTANEVMLKDLLPRDNDFGMTFACDGKLYVTSVKHGSIYRVGLDGTTQRIGNEGSLNPVKISALAAWGNPVRLYGLGNGTKSEGQVVDTPNLYEISLADGSAHLVGALGNQAASYSEGGLAFDDSGQLWAMTDRSLFGLPSQLLKIDHATGVASEPRTLSQLGYESLAITIPRGCQGPAPDDAARFVVQPQYVDGNDLTPVTLTLDCQTGLPLQQSITVVPSLQRREVTFTVTNFQEGALNCSVREQVPAGYSANYSCFSTGSCTAAADRCNFNGVTSTQENLCTIRNTPRPVQVQVTKEWVDSREDTEVPHAAKVELFCTGLIGGDGSWNGPTMQWSWQFDDSNTMQAANVQPRFDGSTHCRTEETIASSAVESIATCADWTPIALGAGTVACSLVNTIFFEGIPTLQPLGLALAALLLLLTGLFATRRF